MLAFRKSIDHAMAATVLDTAIPLPLTENQVIALALCLMQGDQHSGKHRCVGTSAKSRDGNEKNLNTLMREKLPIRSKGSAVKAIQILRVRIETVKKANYPRPCARSTTEVKSPTDTCVPRTLLHLTTNIFLKAITLNPRLH